MKACVIGAGASGFVVMKNLIESGIEVVCYDSDDVFGGAFGLGRAARVLSARDTTQTLLTISNKYMAFTDFPPNEPRRIWHWKEYNDYLRRYAEKFNLFPLIHLNSTVVSVKKTVNGQWEVVVRNDKTKEETKELFDAVAVCTGANQKHLSLPEAKGFTGEIILGSDIHSFEKYRNKKVAVIGMGESGADIVRAISDVSKECHLVVREFPTIIKRIFDPSVMYYADENTSRYNNRSKEHGRWWWLLALVYSYIFYILSPFVDIISYFDINENREPRNKEEAAVLEHLLEPCSLKWSDVKKIRKIVHGANTGYKWGTYFTKNASWWPNLIKGKIQVHKQGLTRSKGNTLFFGDGSQASDVELMVLCIGYEQLNDAFLEKKYRHGSCRDLFKHCFEPSDFTLSFYGLCRPTTGAIPLCAELLAKYWARLLTKQVPIPANVQQTIADDRDHEEKEFFLSPHLSSLVIPGDFYDSIAKLSGDYPNFFKLALNPVAFLKAHFVNTFHYQYVLNNPEMKDFAYRELMGAKIRLSLREMCAYSVFQLLGYSADLSAPRLFRALNSFFRPQKYLIPCVMTVFGAYFVVSNN